MRNRIIKRRESDPDFVSSPVVAVPTLLQLHWLTGSPIPHYGLCPMEVLWLGWEHSDGTSGTNSGLCSQGRLSHQAWRERPCVNGLTSSSSPCDLSRWRLCRLCHAPLLGKPNDLLRRWVGWVPPQGSMGPWPWLSHCRVRWSDLGGLGRVRWSPLRWFVSKCHGSPVD
jgi:hypothetical protein